jgi:L-ascorbate metabolism protein UlaG (beta-lactamase superfamily)
MSKRYKKYLHNPELEFVNPKFSGNPLLDNTFIYGNDEDKISFWKVLRWLISPKPNRRFKKNEKYHVPVVSGEKFISDKKDGILWLGHASFLIRLSGILVLTDPCLRSLPFLKRKTELPFPINKIKDLDYILVSHGHRDHFDIPTVKQIYSNNPDAKFLVPLRMGQLLERAGIPNYEEAGWYQRFKTPRIEIIFLPSRHWHRRGMKDMNKVLWGSFLVRNGQKSVYFGGDTGYGKHFREIRNLIDSSINNVILPIGAYEPSYIMKANHMNPSEAVTAFHELEGKRMIPMHYGSYDLSDEPLGEPEQRIRQLQKQGKINGELKICKIGETVELI